ncbi:hypothetical protein LCGC14_0709790 [marine sediment metagenome]|uniref:Uncharacterized protein n=1 Tax=marine sediment metagenome TaxID=412755 RepID=A0A0F9QK01_9ZZZZ
MKTYRKTYVVLEKGDHLEVGCGDVTLQIEMDQLGALVEVRAQRPATDGRFMLASCSILDSGGETRNHLVRVNGVLSLSPIADSCKLGAEVVGSTRR